MEENTNSVFNNMILRQITTLIIKNKKTILTTDGITGIQIFFDNAHIYFENRYTSGFLDFFATTDNVDFYKHDGNIELLYNFSNELDVEHFIYTLLKNCRNKIGNYKIIDVLNVLFNRNQYEDKRKYNGIKDEIINILKPCKLRIDVDNDNISMIESNNDNILMIESNNDLDTEEGIESDDNREYSSDVLNEYLFDENNLHKEIVESSRKLFIDEYYENSIVDACIAFDKHVQIKSNLDLTGYKLMSKAFNLDNGKLKINKQITKTEKEEQTGFMHLCIGIVCFYRNPGSHEKKLDRQFNRNEAITMLSFLSYLFNIVDKSYKRRIISKK